MLSKRDYMSLVDNKRKKGGQAASTVVDAEHEVANQVFSGRDFGVSTTIWLQAG
jgi:hypothetical protein